jgi:hypothetical protein
MERDKSRRLLSFEDYVFTSFVFDQLSRLMLKQFIINYNPHNVKHTILCNFLARSVVALRGVIHLWEMGDRHDCWVLLRCILDRLFHLKYLKKEDSYDLFEKWSFKKKYEHMLLLRQQGNAYAGHEESFFKVLEEQKERYDQVVKENPKWKRPKPKNLTKELGLEVLYQHGYDYASGMVHPLASDGQEDLLHLLNIHREIEGADPRIVLHDTLLAILLIFQQVLDDSDFRWNRKVYSLISKQLDFLTAGDSQIKAQLVNGLTELHNIELCRGQ